MLRRHDMKKFDWLATLRTLIHSWLRGWYRIHVYTARHPDIALWNRYRKTTCYGRPVDPGRVSHRWTPRFLFGPGRARATTAAEPMAYSGRPHFCCHVSILCPVVIQRWHTIRTSVTSSTSVKHSYIFVNHGCISREHNHMSERLMVHTQIILAFFRSER